MKKQSSLVILLFLSLFNMNGELSPELKKELYRDNTISFDFLKEIQAVEMKEKIDSELKHKNGLEEVDAIQRTNETKPILIKEEEIEKEDDEDNL